MWKMATAKTKRQTSARSRLSKRRDGRQVFEVEKESQAI